MRRATPAFRPSHGSRPDSAIRSTAHFPPRRRSWAGQAATTYAGTQIVVSGCDIDRDGARCRLGSFTSTPRIQSDGTRHRLGDSAADLDDLVRDILADLLFSGS